jgi:ubiquinone/menaquinone biosynthesis C-methylase UbiE
MTVLSARLPPLPESSRYFMEDPREAGRLADKVDPTAWTRKFVDRYLRKDSRVLDVGSGPGVIAAAIAERCPHGQVVAIDQRAARARQAGLRLARHGGYAVIADAEELPFDDASFDLVNCRFLLEYLPAPERAVREMVRVCRPGGRVLLQDLDGQLLWHYPEDEVLERQVSATLAVLARTGFDPYVGRKLYHHCYTAGLDRLSSDVEVYHHYAGAIDAENDRLWNLKLDIAMPAAARALGGESQARALKARFLDYLKRPDTFTYSNLVTVSGVRPK